MSARDGAAGFSLLEMLVAMTLLGLVGVMVAGGVRFGTQVWARGDALSESAIESRVAGKALAALIADARPIRLRDGTRTAPVLFRGAPDAVEFAAAIPAALAPVAPRLVRLRHAPGADGGPGALILDHRPLGRAGLRGDIEARPETLLTGVEGIRLRYYAAATASAPAAWHATWSGREALPDLVELTVLRAGEPLGIVARPRRRE